MRNIFYFIFCISVSSMIHSQDSMDEKLRLLVVTGGGSYESTINTVFDRMNNIEWTHAESDKEAFAEDIRLKYDVVLFYNIGRELEDPARTNLVNYVENGGGVVILHHALASYNSWEWWYKEVVGGRYLLAADGDQRASTYRQGEAIMAIPAKEHPITKVLEGVPFHMYDETYKDLWISPDVQVLLRTGLSTSDGPLLWVSPYDKARVVVFQPGHSSGAHLNLGFRTVLREAILWTGNKLELKRIAPSIAKEICIIPKTNSKCI